MLCCTSDTNIAAENPCDENFTNNDQMWNSQLPTIVEKPRKTSKIWGEWDSHLQIFSLSRAIEISRQYELLRPCWEKNNSGTYIFHHRWQWQLVYYLQRPILMANLNQMNANFFMDGGTFSKCGVLTSNMTERPFTPQKKLGPDPSKKWKCTKTFVRKYWSFCRVIGVYGPLKSPVFL